MPRHSIKNLRAVHVFDVPLREVSGICLRRGRKRKMSLIAVGDRAATIACLALPPPDMSSLEWDTIDVADFGGTHLSHNGEQIEAVCADGAGRVLLLQESPPRVELVDLEAEKSIAAIELVVDEHHELADSWLHPKGSRGEGAVLLPGGHLLVAKEKKPSALIEFGPRGLLPRGFARGGALGDGVRWSPAKDCRAFMPLATWYPDKKLDETCPDFSDLEIGPDGALYLLSDKSATIARIAPLRPRRGAGIATLTASWRLDYLKGKPEGLAFAPDGRAIVALDKRKRHRNLALLEPAVAVAR
jgi:hypothetical protein